MKNVARIVTIAFPFGMCAFAFYAGLSRVTSENQGWWILIFASIIGTLPATLSAYFIIEDWGKRP